MRATRGYTPVVGEGSPCSVGARTPTARELRLESSASGLTGAAPAVAEPPATRPLLCKVLLGFGTLSLLAAVAVRVAAVHSAQLALEPARGVHFRRVSTGSCAERGLVPIGTVEECFAAAQALGLEVLGVSATPADAMGVPEDCYYMTPAHSKGKATLWLNKQEQAAVKLRSLRSLPVGAEAQPLDVRREALCEAPRTSEDAQGVADSEQDTQLSMAPAIPVIPGVVDAVSGLIFGTTTTTTTTTMTTTVTGTTSTLTTTTRTFTTTTSTSTTRTSTSSSTTTGTSTSSTSTMTTTYHTLPSLFCFSVVRVQSYELNNMRTALAKGTSIFGCDESVVFSDQEYTIVPGLPHPGFPDLKEVQGIAPVQTTLLRHDLATHPKQGALEGILNTQIFMQAWAQLDEAGNFRQHDFVSKIDPDAVFLPGRLRNDLAKIAAPSSSPNLYLVNCKISFGLFGAVEVFSRVALEKYIAGEQRCKRELDWKMMGEDLWMRKCFDLLGVQHEDDFNLLSDGYCSDKPSPCQSGKVTFHPFKDALSYLKCYDEATTPTTTTTMATTATVTTSTATATATELLAGSYGSALGEAHRSSGVGGMSGGLDQHGQSALRR